MEYNTKEFAAAIGCSWRTVQTWRREQNGKPILAADHYTNKGRVAWYTDEQIPIGRELLNRHKKHAKDVSENAEDDVQAADVPEIDSDHTPTDGTNAETVTNADSSATVELENPPDVAQDAQQAPFEPAHEDLPADDQKPAEIDDDAVVELLPAETDVPVQIVTLDQRADRIRKLAADVQRGVIEIGLELLAAKSEIGHGNWSEWLEKEFNWKIRTAQNYMAVAARFGKTQTFAHLNTSTLQAMLSLPAGDEQAFLDAQADAGNPITEQSARAVQKAVRQWNDRHTQHEDAPPTEHDDEPETLSAAEMPDVSELETPTLRQKATALAKTITTMTADVPDADLATAIKILETAIGKLKKISPQSASVYLHYKA